MKMVIFFSLQSSSFLYLLVPPKATGAVAATAAAVEASPVAIPVW